jgi:hypothetical protein
MPRLQAHDKVAFQVYFSQMILTVLMCSLCSFLQTLLWGFIGEIDLKRINASLWVFSMALI